jgi:hypothetical protein
MRIKNMKIYFYSILSILFLVTVVGCTKPLPSKEVQWSSGQSGAAPAVANASEFKSPQISVLVNNETLQRTPQHWGPAVVENNFVTQIYDKSGKLIYFKQHYANADWSKLETKFNDLDLNKFLFLEKLKKHNTHLRNATKIFDPQLIVSAKYGAHHPLYQIDYIEATQNGVLRMKASPEGRVLSIEPASAAFEQGHGFIFPDGPKQSTIADVILSQLLGDGTLSKISHKVISQSTEKVVSSDEVFRYDPKDPRFDQVQTFYFVDRALRFFQEQLGVTIPFFLEVQTDVGSPDHTNAMFYYHGQIRLGSGDNVSYANIMKDPSIVTHETCHALIEVLSGLPLGQGEGGSINEAFADFFTTTFLDNPNLAEVAFLKGPYKRTVNNTMKLNEKNGGLYHDSLIVSGTFYEIKKELGTKPALDLAVKSLARMGPTGTFANFRDNVTTALSQGFTDDQKKSVLAILAERGW